MISIIAAVANNRAIGLKNKLIYWLPNDLKRFKALTTGHTIIMGRNTFLSLPKGALPNRRNIVLSRSAKAFQAAMSTLRWKRPSPIVLQMRISTSSEGPASTSKPWLWPTVSVSQRLTTPLLKPTPFSLSTRTTGKKKVVKTIL